WPYTFSPVIVSTTFFLTNLFMASRLYGLTKRKRELILIVLLAITSLVLGVSVASRAWVIKMYDSASAYSALVISWHALQSATAITINALLTRALFKSRSGFLRSGAVIRHLVRGAVQAGLLATICSVTYTIVWIVLPNTSLYSIPGQNVGIFHTSALLSTLLDRDRLRAELLEPSDADNTLGKQVHLTTIAKDDGDDLNYDRSNDVPLLSARTNFR
ncbi:hypothetical protein BC834DRAFT_830656, partial [Gloeopeniophorella convolvens]